MDWSVCTKQVASSRCGNRTSSDFLFVFSTIHPGPKHPLGLLLHSNHKTIFYAIHVCIYVMQSEQKKFHSIVQLQKLIKCDITDKTGCLCHFCQHEVILKMTKYSTLCRQTAVSCMHALLTHVVLNNTRTYSSQSGDCCWLKSVPQEYNNDVTILLLSYHLGEPTVG